MLPTSQDARWMPKHPAASLKQDLIINLKQDRSVVPLEIPRSHQHRPSSSNQHLLEDHIAYARESSALGHLG